MSMPGRDRSGVHLPTVHSGQQQVDAGTRAQAALWLITHGHRDVAQMLGLLSPDTLAQMRRRRIADGAHLPEIGGAA